MSLLEISLQVEPDTIRPLIERLQKGGYTESAIAELLGRFDISELNGKEYPSYIWRCERDESELAELVKLFLLGRAGDRPTFTRILGHQLVEALKTCGVIIEYKEQMGSLPVVYPCLDRFILTDQWVGSGVQTEGKIYELGTDSYLLARVTPRRGVETALDLCTGSGVHAVMSAAVAKRSVAIDINPRALDFTKLNAALNGVECETYLSDLYEKVQGQQFDLITANPPFVSSPDPTVLIHRSAGETGEEVPERLVAGLPEHLNPGGLFSMVLSHPIYEEETYLDRLERWVGQTEGWGIAVLSFQKLTLANYIMAHLQESAEYEAMFRNYLESYMRLGIKSFGYAHVFIRRLPDNQPNWKVEQACVWPNRSIVDQVEEWLDCLQVFHDPGTKFDPSSTPRLSKRYKALWRDWTYTKGALEIAEGNLMQPSPLDSEEAELLALMVDGDVTLEEMKKKFSKPDQFERALRGLGKLRVLDNLRFL